MVCTSSFFYEAEQRWKCCGKASKTLAAYVKVSLYCFKLYSIFKSLLDRFWILIFHCSLANSIIFQTVVTEGDNIEVYIPTVNYVQTHTYHLMFLLYSPCSQ